MEDLLVLDGVDRHTANHPVNYVVIQDDGVFIGEAEVSSAVFDDKLELVFLVCPDLVVSVQRYIQLMHHAVSGLGYNLVAVPQQEDAVHCVFSSLNVT